MAKFEELASQAGMVRDKYGMFFAKDKHNEDGVDLEKFAELIAKECVMLIETTRWHVPPTIQQVANEIRYYFEIK